MTQQNVKNILFLALFYILTSPTTAQLPLGTVSFVADPDQFRIGTNFLAKCEVNIEPKISRWRYRVTYTLNGQELAEYEVNGLQAMPIWRPLTLIPGVNIYPEGRSQYPFFYAMVQPLASGAQGTYQCALKSEFIPTYPSSRSIYYSNKWNTNTSLVTFVPSASVKYTLTTFSEGQGSFGTATYTAECSLSLTPSTGNYNVTFRLGRLPLGEFIVQQEQTPTFYSTILWRTVNTLPGINLFPKYESATYPNFQILLQIQSTYLTSTIDRMQCSVTMEVPKGGSATFFSDPWILYRGNGSQGADLSTGLVVIAIILRLFHYLSHQW